MTNNNHPITPPQWQVDAWCKQALAMGADVDAVFLEATRWGADQELDACCEYMQHEDFHGFAKELRAARRLKPPSLKEQALALIQAVEASDDSAASWDFSVVRHALESLPS